MDVLGANFFHVIDTIQDRLKVKPVPVQLPIGSENQFTGIIDLLKMKAEVYKDDLGKVIEVEEIPEDMLEEAEAWRDKLLEAVADTDEDLMMPFFRQALLYQELLR